MNQQDSVIILKDLLEQNKKPRELYSYKPLCFCFPHYEVTQPTIDDLKDKDQFVRKGEVSFDDLSKEAKEATKDRLMTDETEYKKITEITINDVKDRDRFVKKREASFDDLSPDSQKKAVEKALEKYNKEFKEEALLQQKVDNSNYSWKDIFDQIEKGSVDINLLKLQFLKSRFDQFKELCDYYDSKEQLDKLQKAVQYDKQIKGIDAILKENGEKIKLSGDIVDKIKQAKKSNDPSKRAFLSLYNKSINEPVTMISLAQIRNYGVALVIPDALLDE